MNIKLAVAVGLVGGLLAIGAPCFSQADGDNQRGGGPVPASQDLGPDQLGPDGPGPGPGGAGPGEGLGFRRRGQFGGANQAGAGGNQPGGGWQGMGPGGGGPGSAERRQRMLQRFDANHDGKLDDNERAQMRQFIQQRREQRMARFGQGLPPGGGPGLGAGNPNGGPPPEGGPVQGGPGTR